MLQREVPVNHNVIFLGAILYIVIVKESVNQSFKILFYPAKSRWNDLALFSSQTRFFFCRDLLKVFFECLCVRPSTNGITSEITSPHGLISPYGLAAHTQSRKPEHSTWPSGVLAGPTMAPWGQP